MPRTFTLDGIVIELGNNTLPGEVTNLHGGAVAKSHTAWMDDIQSKGFIVRDPGNITFDEKKYALLPPKTAKIVA